MSKTKKILIIDDDYVFLKVLEDGLSSNVKYKVITAKDGEEGMKKALKEIPDVILVDLMMPKMDGIEFIKKLRENRDFLLIPIFVISQLSSPDKIAETTALGIRGYVIKANFSIDNIMDMIDDVTKDNDV